MECVKDEWVARYLEGETTSKATDHNIVIRSEENQRNKKSLQMGWAIPARATRRLTKMQKVFLNKLFNDGQTSHMVNIKSYFSRRAAAIRKG